MLFFSNLFQLLAFLTKFDVMHEIQQNLPKHHEDFLLEVLSIAVCKNK